MGAHAEKRYGAPYLLIHRGDLQNILLEACAASPVITLKLNYEIAAIEQNASSVTIGNTAFDALIGADGYHSAVRNSLFGAAPVSSGLTAWRTTADLNDRPSLIERASTTLFAGANAHIVTYPIASGMQLNIVTILKNDISLQAGFTNWHADLKTLMHEETQWQKWPLFEVPPLPCWHKGRIALIGDAAHAMLPFAAQGGAMAIEDAVTLANALETHQDAPEAFAHWYPTRQKRTTRVAALARTNQKIYHLPFPLSSARNLGMKILGGKRLLARQDWIYGFTEEVAKPNSSV